MIRHVALFLTVLTGATGLVYEVAWQRYLATLLGSHSEATATVLGIFLAGLSTGYWLFGRVARSVGARAAAARRKPPLLQLYGVIEASIGLYALAFPFLFDGVRSLALRLAVENVLLGFAIDVLLTIVLLATPTILMGGTIPLLTQALSRSVEDSTRFHAFVYAFNTAGAFVGALAAGYALIPWLGVAKLLFAMGAINVAVGAVFVLLGQRSRGGLVPELRTPPPPEHFAAYLGMAFLVGFAMMAIQTVANRLGALAFGSSPFTFSMIVALFVLSIAFGSFAVSALRRVPPWLLRLDLLALFGWLWGLYLVLDLWPFAAHLLRVQFSSVNTAFYFYQATAFLLTLAAIGPAIVLSGATLPLLFHELRTDLGDLGRLAGSLYSWNTIGSLAGALLGGHLLLLWLDLHHVYRIALAAVAAALVLLLLVRERSPGRAAALAAVAALLLVAAPAWDVRSLQAGLFRHRQPLPVSPYDPEHVVGASMDAEFFFHEDDPIQSVAVVGPARGGGRNFRAIMNNGKSDGTTLQDYPTMALAGLLPAVLGGDVERSFVIGWGTGVTVGELAALPEAREVVAAEISPAVLKAAPLFDFATMGASSDPKVRIIRSDAYRALLAGEDRYDAIVSEPSNPWVAGVEMLYAQEFLEAARDRLTPTGVYVQWFHQYETDAASLELVLRTYRRVFPRVRVWYGAGADLLLLGFADGRPPSLEEVEERIARPALAAGLARAGVDGLAELLAHELFPGGVVEALELSGPVHTLYHPRLTHQAGIAFYQGLSAPLPFSGVGSARERGQRGSLLAALLARGERSAVLERAATEACLHRADSCLALSAAWLAAAPDAPRAREHARSVHGETFGGVGVGGADVRVVATLLSGGPAPPAMVSFREAEHARQLYREAYHHGAGFEPARLLAWYGEARCQSPADDARACAREGRVLAEWLGVSTAQDLRQKRTRRDPTILRR